MERQVQIVCSPLLIGAHSLVCLRLHGGNGFARHQSQDAFGFPEDKPAEAGRPDRQRSAVDRATQTARTRCHRRAHQLIIVSPKPQRGERPDTWNSNRNSADEIHGKNFRPHDFNNRLLPTSKIRLSSIGRQNHRGGVPRFGCESNNECHLASPTSPIQEQSCHKFVSVSILARVWCAGSTSERRLQQKTPGL